MFHVHVVPLDVCHVAESDVDQHQGRFSIRECIHHAGPAVVPLDDGRFKGYALDCDTWSVTSPEVVVKFSVIVSATVALTCLAAFIVRRLCQGLRLLFSNSFSVFSTLPCTSSLICPLIIFSFSCTISSGIVYLSLSELCVIISFYQSLQIMSSLILFLFAQLIVHYLW